MCPWMIYFMPYKILSVESIAILLHAKNKINFLYDEQMKFHAKSIMGKGC